MLCLGRTVLHYAVSGDQLEVADKLIGECGASVDVEDIEGHTPLHVATSVPMCALLLRHGAHIDARDSNGRTGLHLSVMRGEGHREAEPSTSSSLIAFFLDKSAEIDATDCMGWNVLHLACLFTPPPLLLRTLSMLLSRTRATEGIGREEGAVDMNLNSSVSLQRDYSSSSSSSKGTLINCAMRTDKDMLSLQLIRLLVDSGANKCNVASALFEAVGKNLLQTFSYLIDYFSGEVSLELRKQLAFSAIREAKLSFVMFFFDHSDDNGSGQQVAIAASDICQVTLEVPFSRSSNVLLYPIEMCLAATVSAVASVAHSSTTESAPEHNRGSLFEVEELLEAHAQVFNFLFQLYTGSNSSGPVYKFDFLTGAATPLLATSLQYASRHQTLFHMLTQWLLLNSSSSVVVDPIPAVTKLGDLSSSEIMQSNNYSNRRSRQPLQVSSLWFILSVSDCCASCRSYWNRFQFRLWRSLLTASTSDESEINVPRQSAPSGLALLISLSLVSNTDKWVKDVVSSLSASNASSNSNSILCLLNEECPGSLRELSASVVRTTLFTPEEVLQLQFDKKLPLHLAKLVGKSFSSLDNQTKALMAQCSDVVAKRAAAVNMCN